MNTDTNIFHKNIFVKIIGVTKMNLSGSLPDTLTIHYAVHTKDRKRMKLKQVLNKISGGDLSHVKINIFSPEV